jgi:hypothetical protein
MPLPPPQQQQQQQSARRQPPPSPARSPAEKLHLMRSVSARSLLPPPNGSVALAAISLPSSAAAAVAAAAAAEAAPQLVACAYCRARWAIEATVPPAAAAAATARFTRCDVRRRTLAGDTLFYAYGVVYDGGPFLEQHPGGKRCMLAKAGGCVEQDIDFHTAHAQALWKKLRIGALVACGGGGGGGRGDKGCAVA